ncbi:MAG TPA: hypothetical protein VEH07_00165 [Alphaproteobacteria bacterium]|nr:hypothetical protein [Alphaproteobacteria bacterium]
MANQPTNPNQGNWQQPANQNDMNRKPQQSQQSGKPGQQSARPNDPRKPGQDQMNRK